MDHTEEQEHERRQQHIEELMEKLEKLAGGPVPMGFSPDCPDEIRERFLEQVLAFEEQDEKPLFDALVESGVQLTPPEELTDDQLGPKLWEVIRAMSLLGHYLYNTNHLSDRQLYQLLWTDTLRVPTTFIPHDPYFACHTDLVGSGSLDDNQIYLRYYADEEERQRWAVEWPEDAMPEREPPPYDRDRHLPVAP